MRLKVRALAALDEVRGRRSRSDYIREAVQAKVRVDMAAAEVRTFR